MGVERTISNFIRALRNAEVRVSTAETLDAMSVVDLVGYEDKAHLKRSLSLACLLYTSPSPRDTSSSRMPSSA